MNKVHIHEIKMPDPTAQEALEALQRLFPWEHGNNDVAVIWAYLERRAEKEECPISSESLKEVPS